MAHLDPNVFITPDELRAYRGSYTEVNVMLSASLIGVFKLNESTSTGTDDGESLIKDALNRRWDRMVDDSVYTRFDPAGTAFDPSSTDVDLALKDIDTRVSSIGNITDENGSGLIVLRTSDDVTKPALIIRRSDDSIAVSSGKPTALLIENDQEELGGNDYQNEVVITFKTGVTTNHRRYIQFLNYDDSEAGYMGMNADNSLIWYNSADVLHHLFAYPSTINSGEFRINSTSTGSVNINKRVTGGGTGIGTGGFKVYDGVTDRGQFFNAYATKGQVLIGYNTPSVVGYQMILGGNSYETGQRGAILINPPSDASNYSTWYGMRVFNPTTLGTATVAAVWSDVANGTNKYGLNFPGDADNKIMGNVGIGGTSFGGGRAVLFIGDASVVPSTNPAAGGVLYAEGGALKWRGSSGTITTIAAA